MPEELIKTIEEHLNSDDLEIVCNECIEKIANLNIGISAVKQLIEMLERNPLADAEPWAVIHYIESFGEYDDILYESVKRSPTLQTVYLLKRICNVSECPEKFRKLLIETAERKDIDKEISALATEFAES
ncbi:MAG: hypothetical protein K2J08_07660 [Ruminococcus sp.]|nr:hypothetical protein [Ruminococcus sp.]